MHMIHTIKLQIRWKKGTKADAYTVPLTQSQKPAFREIPGSCVKKEAFSPFVFRMLYISPGLQLVIQGPAELYWHQFSEPDSKNKKALHH